MTTEELKEKFMVLCLDLSHNLKKPIKEIIDEEEGEVFFNQRKKMHKNSYSASQENKK